MLNAALRVVLFSALMSCAAHGDDAAAQDMSGDGSSSASSGGQGGSGGNAVDTCGRMPRPERLMPVRVADSRAIEPNTIVLATSQDPQTLWLPDAGDNDGAIVIVKEASGVAHRVTVLVLGKDEGGHQTQVAHESNMALSSRTFMVFGEASGELAWTLLDPIE